MRSAIAAVTAVALLASPVLAGAADDGICKASVDPQLEQLSAMIRGADCASAQAVTIAPNVETAVRMTPVFDGPRKFAEPSAVHTEAAVSIVADAYTDRSARLTFFWDQYSSFKDAVHSYNEAVDRVAEPIGEIHAAYMSVVVLHGAPKWVKDVDAALARTVVNVAGGALALGPNLVLFPEALWTAPDRIVSGSSKIRRGISEGHYDYAAKGVAEVCGGVGVLASVATPIAAGFIGRTTPISITQAPVAATASAAIGSEAALVTKREATLVVERVPNSVGAASARVYEASPKHPPWARGDIGHVSKAPKNGAAALENSVEVSEKTRVGIDYETGEYVVFNRTHPHGEVWHGHVRTWDRVRGRSDPLDESMQNALAKSGRTSRSGKILDAPEWAPLKSTGGRR